MLKRSVSRVAYIAPLVCVAFGIASTALAVTNSYEVDLSPVSFNDVLRSGTPPINPGGSPNFADIFLANASFYRSDLASEHDLSVIPAGARLVGDATTEFYVSVSTSGPSNTPVRYYASRGNGMADIHDVLDRSTLVGQLSDTGQGPNRTALDSTFLQELLDDDTQYFALGATYTNGSSGWSKIDRNVGTSFESGTLSFRYEIEAPGATRYDAAPIYDGYFISFDAGVTFFPQLDERTVSVRDGLPAAPDQRLRRVAEFDLSTVPTDTVIQSATINVEYVGRPQITQGLPPTGIVFGGFAGDGIPSTDALQAAGNVIGHSGHFSSRKTYPIAINPFYVEELIRTGGNLGVLLTPEGEDALFSFGALESNTANRFELDLRFAPAPSSTRSMVFEPAADNEVDIDGTPTLAGRSSLINISGGGTSGASERGVLEFNVSAFPNETSSLTGASLVLEVFERLDDTATLLPLSVYGYTGDGIIDPVDALQTSVLLGSAQVGESGLVEIDLDAAEIDSLLSGSDFVGLVLTTDLGLSLFSVETGANAQPPRLTFEFTAPNPPPASSRRRCL